MLVCAIIMLSRLVTPTNDKHRVLFMLLMFLSFPVIVGSVPIERNTIPLVFLIFAMHECFYGKNATIWVNGAIGANPVYFPAALFYIKSKKTVMKDLLFGGSSFILLLLVSGQISYFIGDNVPKEGDLDIYSLARVLV